ncbi:hypothetical protein BU15DRAFT_21250, partial [Melanogaster broomeanus]
LYILHEIDAALDLSHVYTTHGQLFKNWFEGVLFRMRFRDGTSIVERAADRPGSSLYQQGNDQSAE